MNAARRLGIDRAPVLLAFFVMLCGFAAANAASPAKPLGTAEAFAEKLAGIHGAAGQKEEAAGHYRAALEKYRQAVAQVERRIHYTPAELEFPEQPMAVYFMLGSARLDMVRMWALLDATGKLTDRDRAAAAQSLKLALLDLQTALKLDQTASIQAGNPSTPSTWMLHRNLGWAYLLHGDVAESQREFVLVEQLKGGEPQTIVGLALAEKVGQVKQTAHDQPDPEKLAAYAKVALGGLKVIPKSGNFLSAIPNPL